MYLAGEVTHKGVEAIVSSPRLLKVRSHVTSSSKDGIYIYSLKVTVSPTSYFLKVLLRGGSFLLIASFLLLMVPDGSK